MQMARVTFIQDCILIRMRSRLDFLYRVCDYWCNFRGSPIMRIPSSVGILFCELESLEIFTNGLVGKIKFHSFFQVFHVDPDGNIIY